MSDTVLYLIPIDPFFEPSLDAATQTAAGLRNILGRDDVTVEYEDSVSFFDPGGNWSGVDCPVCGADIEAWWSEVVDAACADGFASLEVSTQCCGSLVSLNNLRYRWPAGFAKFALKVWNPGAAEIRQEELQGLSGLLGVELKQIWQRL